MNAANPRDRIWDRMVDTERMARYYARRAEMFKASYMRWSFTIVALQVLAIASYQFYPFGGNGPVIAFSLLVVVSLVQAYLLQYAPSVNERAASTMGLQSGKLAEQWRKLWIDYENPNGSRGEIELWIEFLEDQTKHVTVTSIPYDEKTNEECNREAKHGIERQFGG